MVLVAVQDRLPAHSASAETDRGSSVVSFAGFYEYLIAVEGLQWGRGTAARGAEERLAPILMTALATALGLLPLAIGSGDPGREIEGPMAWVILGGLFTSTALNLLVMPSLALRYAAFESSAQEGEP